VGNTYFHLGYPGGLTLGIYKGALTGGGIPGPHNFGGTYMGGGALKCHREGPGKYTPGVWGCKRGIKWQRGPFIERGEWGE